MGDAETTLKEDISVLVWLNTPDPTAKLVCLLTYLLTVCLSVLSLYYRTEASIFSALDLQLTGDHLCG